MTDNIYITLAKHCIGLDHNKPYKRHGRYFYRPYRNHYDAGGKDVKWSCGEEVYLWWMQDNNVVGQMELSDFIEY